MNWTSEEHFVTSFVGMLMNSHHSDNFYVLREVKTSYGRPDVVVIEYDQDKLNDRRRRIPISKNLFTKECAYVMAFLTYRRGLILSGTL